MSPLRFQSIRGALEALVQTALVLAALSTCASAITPGFHCGKGRAYATAMKSDLRNLVSAQEAFRAEHGRFGVTLDEIGFRQSTGVRVTLVTAGAREWSARATHVALEGSCSMSSDDAMQPRCQGLAGAGPRPGTIARNISVDLWLFAISFGRYRDRRRRSLPAGDERVVETAELRAVP